MTEIKRPVSVVVGGLAYSYSGYVVSADGKFLPLETIAAFINLQPEATNMTNIMMPCVVCGSPTIGACSDCAIESHGQFSVHVCDKAACRDQHERERHQNNEAVGGGDSTTTEAGRSPGRERLPQAGERPGQGETLAGTPMADGGVKHPEFGEPDRHDVSDEASSASWQRDAVQQSTATIARSADTATEPPPTQPGDDWAMQAAWQIAPDVGLITIAGISGLAAAIRQAADAEIARLNEHIQQQDFKIAECERPLNSDDMRADAADARCARMREALESVIKFIEKFGERASYTQYEGMELVELRGLIDEFLAEPPR